MSMVCWRADHVVVVVLGELHVEAVGGFGGVALADVVGEDEEVFGDVEGLAGAEEDVGEDGVEEGVARRRRCRGGGGWRCRRGRRRCGAAVPRVR